MKYRIKEYEDGYKIQTGHAFGLFWFNKTEMKFFMNKSYNEIVKYKTIEDAKEQIERMKRWVREAKEREAIKKAKKVVYEE